MMESGEALTSIQISGDVAEIQKKESLDFIPACSIQGDAGLCIVVRVNSPSSTAPVIDRKHRTSTPNAQRTIGSSRQQSTVLLV